jgi:transposase
MIDNASIHRSSQSLDFYEDVGLNVFFLAPYSFEMAAVERLFSYIKNRDQNPLAVRAYSRYQPKFSLIFVGLRL